MKKIAISILAMVMLVVLAGCQPSSDYDMLEIAIENIRAENEANTAENEALKTRIAMLEDMDAVEKVVNNLFIQTDNMDWNVLVNDVFTEMVYFDMTSVGGTAGDVTSQSIVQGWAQGFESIESVHHQSGNMQIEIEGNRATVFQYGTATQYATTVSGNNTRTFIGTYTIGLIKEADVWKVDTFGFHLKMMDGNIAFE